MVFKTRERTGPPIVVGERAMGRDGGGGNGGSVQSPLSPVPSGFPAGP